ncbi:MULTISPECIES: cation diffusion facilitator family transporter [Desulfobacula]|uniref:Predicted cation efflux protein n=2 Tax=Desulfobacula TaxID=28222 RepID=K0NJ87_DESTT|nr:MULTISPECIES: cation diffusion facilitator family transporter [Desulfobacula]CCK79943.1 predicted cation efflux protein [Desulfobacula toluolica Tol2]SDU18664.1 cation diffusion facilitator family transporter [Desulfobacula phenolica]
MENSKIIDKREQLKKGQHIALLSTLLILALALLKAFVGYRFNSPLLVADAWHSGADILINLSSLFGLIFASKKKSSKFPYGLYRAETLACLLIGILIAFIGIDLFKEGWHKLFMINSRNGFPVFPIGASIVSCVVASVLAVKQRAIGKAIGSQALLATSQEAFFDIFTSLFVLVGILCVYAQIAYVEGAVIVLIAVLIMKLGIETAWKSIMVLMDANMDTDLKMEIEEKLNQIQGVQGVCDVKIRQSGPFKIVNCIIKTTPSLVLYKSHELADIAENMLLTKYDNIASVFVHVEPEKETIETAVIPVQDKNGLDSILHKHFGRAPYFIILNIGHGLMEIESYLANDFLDKKGHVGVNVVKAIIDYKINLLFVSSIGEISFHMLKNSYVDIIKIDREMSVKEIISLYKENKLDPITRPDKAKINF